MIKSQQPGLLFFMMLISVTASSGMARAANISYQDYVKMSKVSEANALFTGLKAEIINYYVDKGAWPLFLDLKAYGAVYKGIYTEVSYIDGLNDSRICIKVSGFETGKDSIGWRYMNDPNFPPMSPFFWPKTMWNCKAIFSGCTTIEDKYLPKACQSTSPDF
jgi:type IV pilus assembly protein PilA